jgi:hypothetical protein
MRSAGSTGKNDSFDGIHARLFLQHMDENQPIVGVQPQASATARNDSGVQISLRKESICATRSVHRFRSRY